MRLARGRFRGTSLDLACNEGFFAHLALVGAARVVGIDIRTGTVRRVELVRDHFGVSPKRLELRAADVLALDPEELGSFDVVLALGLVSHLENPVGAVRLARKLTRRSCVIESHLTRQSEPLE